MSTTGTTSAAYAASPNHDDQRTAELLRYAERLELAFTVCKQLAPTALMPDTLKIWANPDAVGADGKPDHTLANLDQDATAIQAAGIMVTAQGLGIPADQALRTMVIIAGTPALYAQTARSLVLARGHELYVDEAQPPTNSRAIVRGRRNLGGGNFGPLQTSTWTIDRARNLAPRGFGNPNGQWKRQPQNLLVARATMEVARLIASDVLLGIYAAEELNDSGEPEMDTATDGAPPAEPEPGANGKTPSKPARRARRPLPAITGTEAARPATDTTGPIHDDTRTRLYAGMRDIGITGRTAALGTITLWLRDLGAEGGGLAPDAPAVGNASELTEAQALHALGKIDEEKARQAREAQNHEGEQGDQPGADDGDPGPGEPEGDE